MESNVAFSDAVARARQIAAKLGNSTGGGPPPPGNNKPGFNPNPLTGGLSDKGNPNNMPLGVKRNFPGGGDDEFMSKKPAPTDDQQRSSAKDLAKMAAEQVAAKLNQSIGMSGGPGGAGPGSNNPPIQSHAGGGFGGHSGLGFVTSEEWSIPNKVVGLVIGSKGETITQIQAQSGCRIQIAPDPLPGQIMQDRHVSLNGTADSIAKAKDLINKTINEAGHSQHMGFSGGMGSDHSGSSTVEMMIPGNKVGLVIGKGGDTIKQLQAKSGCKMMMLQDGHWQNAPEKPLKITGDPNQIETAKGLVKELIDSKDIKSFRPGSNDMNGYGNASHLESIPVPREAVGIIIGKGGDMIKNIQGQFNVKIQFQNDAGGPQRVCDISGNQNDVYAAKQHVQELISDSQNRPGGMGGGPGGPRGPWPSGGAPPGGAPPGPGGMGRGGFGGQDQTSMRVPAERCGIVIGKGGETIRGICEMSGAHVELNRNAPPGPDKEFSIRGTPEQIQHAMHLINEKISVPPRGPGGPGGPAPGGWGGPQQGGPFNGGPGQWNGPPSGPGGYGGPQQQQQQQQQPNWGNYNYNQWGQGQQPQQQPGAGGADQQSNEQAWQAYYAQYYGQYQQQQQQQPGAPNGQPSAAPAAPSSNQAQPAPTSQAQAPSSSTATSSTPQPKINPVTGEPDYTEAWVAYYRQMGWHDQAEAILKQAQSSQHSS